MRSRSAAILAACVLLGAAPGALAAVGAHTAYRCEDMKPTWALDGKFGPDTERAVRAYQAAKGLKVDGVAGMDTAWALRVTYRQPLKCGMVGPDVLELQRALKRAGFWEDRWLAATPAPVPSAAPTEPPPRAETPPPIPAPEPTPEPTPPPQEPDLSEIPPDFALETPPPPPQARSPWLTARLGTWLVPVSGTWFMPMVSGAPSTDFSVLRNNLSAELAYMPWPNWGAGAAFQMFDLANTTFDLGPFDQPGMLMYDAHLIYRFADFYQLRAGYRGLGGGGASGQNYLKLGFFAERPFVGDWLWWRFGLDGGSNFGADYFYDARAGLGLRLGVVGLDLGFRHLGLQIGASPLATINGPTVEVGLHF